METISELFLLSYTMENWRVISRKKSFIIIIKNDRTLNFSGTEQRSQQKYKITREKILYCPSLKQRLENTTRIGMYLSKRRWGILKRNFIKFSSCLLIWVPENEARTLLRNHMNVGENGGMAANGGMANGGWRTWRYAITAVLPYRALLCR